MNLKNKLRGKKRKGDKEIHTTAPFLFLSFILLAKNKV